MEIDSILFDLDGTLWDSVDGIVISWNTTLQQYSNSGIKLTRETVMPVMGTQLPDIAKKLFVNLSEEERQEVMKKCGQSESDYLQKQGA